MAVTRVSPGMYSDGKRTIRATTQAEAEQMFSGGRKPGRRDPGANPGRINPVTEGGLTAEKGGTTVSDPFGTTHIGRDPKTGGTIINSDLTGANKDLNDAQQQAGTIGAGIAGNLLKGIPGQPYDANTINNQYGIPQVDDAYFKQGQDAAYTKLTDGLDAEEQRAYAAKKQELYNQGVPLDSDQMRSRLKLEVGDRFDKARADARNTAVLTGNTLSKDRFGMGLDANQTALSNYQSNYSFPTELAGSLNAIGTVQKPVDPMAAFGQQSQNQNLKKTLANQIAQARMQGRGGGGGGGAAPVNTDPDFV